MGDIKPDKFKCPTCLRILESRSLGSCPNCGLWWVKADNEETLLGTISQGPSFSLEVVDNTPILFYDLIISFVFVCIGYGAAFLSAVGIYQSPFTFFLWAKFLVGVFLGGVVGTCCALTIAQLFLHRVIPGRLVGDSFGLRVRVWHTWSGLLDNFSRTDIVIPRNEIKGVGFTVGQGGETLLFILHASGYMFGTGWHFEKSAALHSAEPILRWISGGKEITLVKPTANGAT